MLGFKNTIARFFNRSPTVVRYELVTDRGNGFYSWNGKLYRSDIVRSCIRPFYKSVGKLLAKQIRQNGADLKINPDFYIKTLLEEPNPYMTGQMLQEKLAIQLKLNNNAFAYINRDDNGFAMEIYPLTAAIAVEAIYDNQYQLYLKFTFQNGRTATFAYDDVIHLRQDYYSNDIFGEGNQEVLAGLMEIVITIDQGIIKAIKNGAVIKWLLQFKGVIRPEDIQAQTKKFVDDFLKIDTENNDSIAGAAGTDSKADVKQIQPTDYVPNASQLEKTVQRIQNYFGTNDKIIQSKFNEDDWNAYFEAEIEPFSIQASNEFSRKIFSRRERSFGNRIIFEANSLQYASMKTKLDLMQMVDRGALTPNEWRLVLNMGPIEGGEKAVRRLDTAVVNQLMESFNAYSNQMEEIKALVAGLLSKGGD
ncbi:phage portal protein [Pelosinus sp. IPA-1]|uniref:phage portal protein n=1 Tax=Pelosinus sp. IPA-1 TaxID=3029569 RepID=UPI00243617FF|nr:phage portal protein [Pelosinus sp. IPA-1]GMB01065.1 hypothetical protein PIPA1_38640 [Pelosinus sp. IPA-1]